MSQFFFFASDAPLTEVKNDLICYYSINDLIEKNHEVPELLIGANVDPDAKVVIQVEDESDFDEITIKCEINIQHSYGPYYTSKPYIAELSWRYNDERARKLIQYIQEQFDKNRITDIELWYIWKDELIDEVAIKEVNLSALATADLKLMFDLDHYIKPTCLKVIKESEQDAVTKATENQKNETTVSKERGKQNWIILN
ncbi:MAG: hypothetical protein BGO41_14720 [Clostridiales bacterium 38-18]|nr:MAG: hypothetical protein BGO41_14720 [Clostridiales bacterium 38-18]